MKDENKTDNFTLTYKQIKVKEILLTPIIADKHLQNGEIFINNGMVYSGQQYYGTLDPDMSDFAVKFYEIVYHCLLCNTNLLTEKTNKKAVKYWSLTNDYLAGDTMNSFSSVASFITNKSETNFQLLRKRWFLDYHCLANFWLIPSDLGRSFKSKYSKGRKEKFDSLDLFLDDVKNNTDLRDSFKDYFHEFNKNTIFDFDNFLSVHYLNNYKPFTENGDEIKHTYKNSPDEIIKKMIECIELRADNIVCNSEKDEEGKTVCDRLYDFFKENNLL